MHNYNLKNKSQIRYIYQLKIVVIHRKMCSNRIRCFFLLIYVKFSIGFNSNIPFNVFSECKEYQIDGDYNYRDAFAISNMKNNKPYENEIFRLKFYVFTRNDAHILITNEPRAQVGDPAYEIGMLMAF